MLKQTIDSQTPGGQPSNQPINQPTTESTNQSINTGTGKPLVKQSMPKKRGYTPKNENLPLTASKISQVLDNQSCAAIAVERAARAAGSRPMPAPAASRQALQYLQQGVGRIEWPVAPASLSAAVGDTRRSQSPPAGCFRVTLRVTRWIVRLTCSARSREPRRA